MEYFPSLGEDVFECCTLASHLLVDSSNVIESMHPGEATSAKLTLLDLIIPHRPSSIVTNPSKIVVASGRGKYRLPTVDDF